MRTDDATWWERVTWIILASCLFWLIAASALCADLTLAWEPPANAAECGVLTYRVYVSTNGGSAFFAVTNTAALTATVSNRFGVTVYAVTALNAAGDESDRSDTLTVARVMPRKPTITKYTITTEAK